MQAQEELDFLGAQEPSSDYHQALAAGTEERVFSPHAQDEVAPERAQGACARGGRRWNRRGRWWVGGAVRVGPELVYAIHAAMLVRVESVIADGLLVFGRDVFEGGGEEVGSGEDLEIALGTPAPAGTVDDTAGGLVPCDLFERERGAEEVLGQAAAAFDVVGRDRFVSGVEVESAVFPAEKVAEFLLADEFLPAQCLQKAVAKQFCQRLDGLDWHEVEAVVPIEKAGRR